MRPADVEETFSGDVVDIVGISVQLRNIHNLTSSNVMVANKLSLP
jgi:hypothetical protein